MSYRPRHIATITQVSLLALSFYSLCPPLVSEVEAKVLGCDAAQEIIRTLESTIGSALEQVRRRRRKAQNSADWYGREEFGPYVDVLRDQEKKAARRN